MEASVPWYNKTALSEHLTSGLSAKHMNLRRGNTASQIMAALSDSMSIVIIALSLIEWKLAKTWMRCEGENMSQIMAALSERMSIVIIALYLSLGESWPRWKCIRDVNVGIQCLKSIGCHESQTFFAGPSSNTHTIISFMKYLSSTILWLVKQ